jgi:hypothetical protein
MLTCKQKWKKVQQSGDDEQNSWEDKVACTHYIFHSFRLPPRLHASCFFLIFFMWYGVQGKKKEPQQILYGPSTLPGTIQLNWSDSGGSCSHAAYR